MAWLQTSAVSPAATQTNTAVLTGCGNGSLLVIFVCQNFNSTSPQTPTMSFTVGGESAPTQLINNLTFNGTNNRLDVYYKVTTASGNKTAQADFGSAQDASRMWMLEYDGAHTVPGNTNTNTGTASPLTPGSVTPTGTALYVSGGFQEGIDTTTPPGGIWNNRLADFEASPNTIQICIDAITTGAQNPAWTKTGTNPWGLAILTFTPAAGGGTTLYYVKA
jgi:hypothetical protein